MSNITEKEMKKLNTIKKVLGGEYTKKEASEILGISIRHINRLILRYQDEGEKGFIHKNKGKASQKKISEQIKEEIINLYVTEYFDYNFTHFYEEIKERYQLSQRTISTILSEADIVSPESQHKTIKLYNANMKKAIRDKKASKEQVVIYEKRQEAEKQKHIRRSTLLYNFGQEVQMDATFAMWYGDKATALHLAVDKATKKVLYGWFDTQETTRAYLVILMNILLNYGIPKKIKTDKRGTFSLNNVRAKSKLNTTQFGRICEELEIYLSSSSDPLFKPNVERENKTFKGRLISELRHESVVDDAEANKYLNEVFIPKMNAKFSYAIDEDKNDVKETNYSKEELNIIISEQYTRKIDNASSIKYKGNHYVPVDSETGEIISFSQNTVCTIIIAYDYTYWCKIEGNLYALCSVKAPEKRTYQKTTKTQEEINRSKAHKPAVNHPWRKYKEN